MLVNEQAAFSQNSLSLRSNNVKVHNLIAKWGLGNIFRNKEIHIEIKEKEGSFGENAALKKLEGTVESSINVELYFIAAGLFKTTEVCCVKYTRPQTLTLCVFMPSSILDIFVGKKF